MTTDERLQRLRVALKGAGHRYTSPRNRLLHAFVSCEKPVSAQELRRLVGGQADVVTTHRLLSDLLGLGLAIRFVRIKGTFEFLLCEEGDDHVHHLICDRCGRSEAFRECVVEKWLNTNPAPCGFRVEYHLFTLYGICRTCRRNGEETPKEKI